MRRRVVGVVTWRRRLANRVLHRSSLGAFASSSSCRPEGMRLTEARRPEPMNQTSAPSRSANATPGIARAVSGSATSGRYSPQGALSTISGVGFTAVAVADDTVHLGMLAPYAATGGVFFVIPGGAARPPFPPAVESAASVPA